ncbi:Histidine kinase-like ATPase domain-containing protein [Fervidobacterium changbaicum]|uniref:CBS domain-containing protein n=2 Tax=Fervidobacterium TaxID=2422 RepID=A0AAI8CLN3_FERIS|nr:MULTISPECIES: CBS domain-containing protein [Fervidobacterium]AMW32628.1 CBS domain-containing protein [Fervidobacterium islandicum]QAV32519.1 CBS domain-containing protein [Fervidobacterium changbaicum]SDH51005.1 Histidine kinase-like ATPase domain-containing protein [Fervidobacterium changbaicum]
MTTEILEKVQKVFANLSVKEFMTKEVIYVKPDRTVAQVKEILRLKRISGVPVVNDDNVVIGIISIEDIIKCLENGTLNESVSQHMTKNVVCISEDSTLQDVIKHFERFRYGRFPVVDTQGRLVGIVTKNDILAAVATRLGLLYLHDERRKEVLEKDALNRSLVTGEEIDKKGADFYFKIDYFDVNLAGIGAAQLKKFLQSKGIPENDVRRVAVATYEAETNVVIHSGSEGEIFCFLTPDRIIVRVEDKGKGIENIELAMKEGYSTAPDYVRELGFGAGMGLPNMKRFSDKMVVLSEKGKGVVVEMVFYINNK